MSADTLTKDQSLELMQAEIERLRGLLRYEQERNANNVAIADAEIERLRGLLQWWINEGCDPEWDDDDRRAWTKRVREALGE